MASRREFIRLVLMGTGATYALSLGACNRPSEMRVLRAPQRTQDTPKFAIAHALIRGRAGIPEPSKTYTSDVVIVGAGLSGLAAAATLEQQGYSVTIVENESKVGGSAVSRELGGGLAPLGSVYFVEETPELKMLMDLGGIEPLLCPDDGYDFGHGEVIRDLWQDDVLDYAIHNDADRDGMKRFRDQLLGMDNLPLYPLPRRVTDDLRYLDVSAEDWVKEFNSQTLTTVLNSYSRSSMGALLSRTNLFCLLNFYSSEFGPSFDLPRYTLPGGTGAIAAAVSPKLSNVKSDHLVVRVRQNNSGSSVDAVNENGEIVRFKAASVIVAAPKYQVPYLVEDLPSANVKACKELAYAPYITLHLVSDLPLLEPDVYDTWNLTSEFETDVVNPGSVPGSTFNKNVASLYLPMDQFARGVLENPELFARKVTDVVDRFMNTKSLEQQASLREIYAWGWGHGIIEPTPGSHSGIAQQAMQSVGRIHFAGTDCDAAPAIEIAVYHGARAARDVMDALKGPTTT